MAQRAAPQRILALTYPLTPVGEGACGGAEQVAWHLLRRLGQRPQLAATWIGADGSASLSGVARIAWSGLGVPAPSSRSCWTPTALAALLRRCRQAVRAFLADHAVDLIHDQGAWFFPAPPSGPPLLFTLHLARRLYPPALFASGPLRPHFQLVSRFQQREYPDLPGLPVVANGIDLQRFPARLTPAPVGAPLLFLGRICPEKAPHLAIALARRARRRLWIVGAVSPFPDHRRYFAERIAPALHSGIRWFPPPSPAGKRRLLRAAAAVVIPSQIEETSSLVAMEAAASGVPVLALRRGALPEIIAQGETGWLADDPEALGAAVPRLAELSPAACRARAERYFDADRMAADYLALYRRLASPAPAASAA
ncbi:MAG TPA: glycosyltransferase [Terriglobales bacterium]|nr:glycosyltransferase [Terriglobales bacterium]